MIEAMILLAVFGVQDFKTKQLDSRGLWGALILAAGLAALKGKLFPEGILGMLLGVFMMAVSRLTKGQLGDGDALILMTTGLLLGLRQNLELFFLALFLASIYSGYLLIVKHQKRNYEIAFVPFLASAQLLLLILLR